MTELLFIMTLAAKQVNDLQPENFSIGIVLCKEKNNTVVEFSVKSIDKAMGVATFKTSKEIPREIKRVLPNTDGLRKLL